MGYCLCKYMEVFGGENFDKTYRKVENKQICCIPHVFIPSDYTDN